MTCNNAKAAEDEDEGIISSVRLIQPPIQRELFPVTDT